MESDKEFIKKMIKLGKVKPASEAFDKFPPEEEDHKGDPNYFLQEQPVKYSPYSVGDIVFVNKFTYSNGTEGTKHLFIIISDDWGIPFEFFCLLISLQTKKLKYSSNKALFKNNQNGLHKDSIVKLDTIYKIKNEDILFKIGSVDKQTIDDYRASLS